MAPRRSLRNLKAPSLGSPTLYLKLTTTKVSKEANDKKSQKRRSARLAAKVEGMTEAKGVSMTEHTPVVLLENGLVSMEKTPKHLVQIVERNATTSPLLRLPGELRNKIWALAMGGHYICFRKIFHSQTRKTLFLKTVFRAQTSLSDKTHHSTAFHLPEVCRQIYSETATLGYSLNTFIVDLNVCIITRDWADGMLPAQRSAVTSIVPQSDFFEPYVLDDIKAPLRKRLPNLKKIEVPGDAVTFVRRFHGYVDVTRTWQEQEWRDWCLEQIDKKEGGNIEVFFHEPEGIDTEAED